MKIVSLETFPVRIPYQHREESSIVDRDGVGDVIVKLRADNGLVGWGERCTAADTAGIESAIRAVAPFVLGRDPWQSEAIYRDSRSTRSRTCPTCGVRVCPRCA